MPHEPSQTSQNTAHAALVDALNVSFRILRWAMLFALVAYLFSGVRIVRQDQQAFVLVMGRISGLGADRVKGPGIHWIPPRPFAELVPFETKRVQTIESATFWTKPPVTEGPAAGAPGGGAVLKPGVDGYSLTGDANLIHSRWALSYTIADPEAYGFRFQDPRAVLHRELDHAILETTARFAVDRALRTDIEALRADVASQVRSRCDELGLGIKVERIDVLALAPPRQVAESFAAVIAAENERSQTISAARAYATGTINEAGGAAARVLSEGETYKREVVSRISANADYFSKVYVQYAANPDVIGQTLLQDTLRRVLAQVDQKYILGSNAAIKQELRILISPEPQPLPPHKP